MLSLYEALLSQHARQLTPVRCAEQTIAQLHQYFEDVVLDNRLGALVVESLPGKEERSARGIERISELARVAQHAFFFVAPEDTLLRQPLACVEGERPPELLARAALSRVPEHFILIADARFSAVLVTSVAEQPAGESRRASLQGLRRRRSLRRV